MKTLYDLLGALPDDDAEDLRIAFRKAVKANHPDLNPGDPEASQAFRRIIRANAILSDERQREAYDRLLEVARRQQIPKSMRNSFARRSRRLGADAMVSAVASVVFIGGYFLLKPVDRPPLASAQIAEISSHEQAQATHRSTELSSQERTSPDDRSEDAGAGMKFAGNPVEEPARPDSIASAVTTGLAIASADVPPAREPGPKDVKYYRERGTSAYRSGDLYIALANFDLAIQQDPVCSDCYVDRGIVLHRMGDLKGAFSDVAEARRIDASNRKKTFSEASPR
jgi:curved DNA-binding protein CbpA